MLKEIVIRRGVEVFVKNKDNSNLPEKKARVIKTYTNPSRELGVTYEEAASD